MPRYIALRATLLAHEGRVVKEGEEFTTEFPQVANDKGDLVDMKLGDNLRLVEEEKPNKKQTKGGATDGLV